MMHKDRSDPSHLILISTECSLKMTHLRRKDQTAVPNSNYCYKEKANCCYCTQPGRGYVAETNVQTA